MKLRSLLFVALIGTAGYYAYSFAVTQFNQPALVYKRYCDALMRNEPARAKSLVLDAEALRPFNTSAVRRQQLGGTDRFIWYTFLDQRYSTDGKSVTMVVKQTVRVDPPGSDSFFGTEIRSDRHMVTLVKDKSTWKVKHFEDGATQGASAQHIAQR